MSGIVPTEELNDAFRALKDAFPKNKFDKVGFKPFYDKFVKPKPLLYYLEERRREKGITPNLVDSHSIYEFRKKSEIFTQGELAALLGCSQSNILARERLGELEMHKNEFKPEIRITGDTLDDLNITETYVSTLKSIAEYMQTSGNDKFRAIEIILKYVEPKVIDELKAKFATLNGLINFILNHLVPEVNRRVRNLVKDLIRRANTGEDMSKVSQPDVRLLFKELLPSSPELLTLMEKDGWIKKKEA